MKLLTLVAKKLYAIIAAIAPKIPALLQMPVATDVAEQPHLPGANLFDLLAQAYRDGTSGVLSLQQQRLQKKYLIRNGIVELAGAALPNYRLLYSKYGVEFIPQGMEDLKPLPSGLLGPVSLVEGSAER